MKIRIAALALVVASHCVVQAIAAQPSSADDHANMMRQIGVTKMRPGPSGDEKAPNHANYDEAAANPFTSLPDALITNDGKRVTTAAMWKARRAEIVDGFEREVYGRVPKIVPTVSWRVVVTDREFVGRTPVIAKQLIGHVDNSSFPGIDVDIAMTVVVPANAKGPVPLLMMFGRSALPAPAQPDEPSLEKLNTALRMMLEKSDPSLKELLDRYPAYAPLQRAAGAAPQFGPPPVATGGVAQDPPTAQQLVADGWGYAMIDPASIQADNGAGLTRGIIGLVNKGQPRKPDDWGSLRAWAWGAARGLDYLQTDAAVDAKHVGIEGVSRYGKAALVTLAFEERFAIGLIGSSGKGGATLHRRNFGEAVESLTGSGEYHWMAGNYLKYGADDGAKKSVNELPVDSHELIALCAPRLTFISYGIPEKGDAKWLDHEGSFMAAVAAQPVFRLLGAKDLGVPDTFATAKMPPVNSALTDGVLAWRQHDGGHTDAPNVKYFIQWADKQMGRTAPQP